MRTDPLAEAVRGFLDDWNRTRPSTAGQFTSPYEHEPQVEPVRALEWLADESAVPETTIENIVYRRYQTTELRIADALTQAIGRPDLLQDGEALEPFPNPNAPARVRGGSDGRCGCSGSSDGSSLTGAASFPAV